MATKASVDGHLATSMYYFVVDQGKPYDSVDWAKIFKTNSTSPATREVRARTLMFVQVLVRCYGVGQDEAKVGKVAMFANQYIMGLSHANPRQIEAWFRSPNVKGGLALSNNPLFIPPEPHDLGAALLTWKCNYVFRGQFNWKSDRTEDFSGWLKSNATHKPTVKLADLSAGANISCWEAVFYAMIMTGTMDIAPVRQAYAESKDKDTGDACFKMLMKMLADRKRELEKIVMTAENYKDQRLTVGDIILIPGDKYDDDATSVLHHVVLVIADTGSDGPDSTEIFHLWGEGASNFCDIARLGDVTYTLKHNNYEARFFRCQLLS